MDEISIPRTGMPPLRFKGEVLAQSDGKLSNGREQNRWHEITVYRTQAENYVIAVTLRSQWAGETDHYFAETCRDPAAVNQIVQDHDPVEHLQGYPSGSAYADKQARLVADVRRRYADLATEVYTQLGAEFAEVIE